MTVTDWALEPISATGQENQRFAAVRATRDQQEVSEEPVEIECGLLRMHLL